MSNIIVFVIVQKGKISGNFKKKLKLTEFKFLTKTSTDPSSLIENEEIVMTNHNFMKFFFLSSALFKSLVFS